MKDFVGVEYHYTSGGRGLLNRKMQRRWFGEAVNEINQL
jgi:hypothetical protein